MSIEIAEERAAAGASFLDEKIPGWHAKIELNDLDMADPQYPAHWSGGCGCVLAQLDYVDGGRSYSISGPKVGFYIDKVAELGVGAEVIELGFATSHLYQPTSEKAVTYAELNEAWRDEITRRRVTQARVSDPASL